MGFLCVLPTYRWPVYLFCVFVVFSPVCFELSVPVQVIVCKNSSLKRPVMCQVGHKTLLTHSFCRTDRPRPFCWILMDNVRTLYSYIHLFLFTPTAKFIFRVFTWTAIACYQMDRLCWPSLSVSALNSSTFLLSIHGQK